MVKSSLLLGLGETDQEVLEALSDLRLAGVEWVTLGQYLQPTRTHHPVTRYVPPEEFENWHKIALDTGFDQAACSPLTRSSYLAYEVYNSARQIDPDQTQLNINGIPMP